MESLSFLFLSKCFLTETAFLIKEYKSSGISGAKPLDFKILKILLPVQTLAWETPWASLKITPIWDGVKPFLAYLMICSTTSFSVNLNQAGAFLEYGAAEEEIPLPYNMLVNSTFKAKAQTIELSEQSPPGNLTMLLFQSRKFKAWKSSDSSCPNNLTLQ